jgi:hypothetical protein
VLRQNGAFLKIDLPHARETAVVCCYEAMNADTCRQCQPLELGRTGRNWLLRAASEGSRQAAQGRDALMADNTGHERI